MSLAWGGYQNGQIPETALVRLSAGGLARAETARRYEALAVAFKERFDIQLAVTDAYRPLAAQQAAWLRYQKEGSPLAARPGTSNHGWGRAIDFGSGVASASSPQFVWMTENAPAYGWVAAGMRTSTQAPAYTGTGVIFSQPEPWHWEDTGTVTASLDSTPIIEQEDIDMTLFYQPTNNSSPLKDGTSRIWAGSRTIGGIDYADVWGVADNGDGRRLTRKQWVDLYATAQAKNVTLPVIPCTGNELEQIIYAARF